MHMIKVIIVDDHAFVRGALGDLLAATDDIRVVAECSDGCDVVEVAALANPDVVLMDLAMPVMSGLEATRALRDAQPGIRVIMLTGSLTTAAAREARALGVRGFLLKGEDGGDVLPEHIRAVAAGGTAWNVAAARQAALPRVHSSAPS
jgi:DNA-binding NarL/FixJ family response regulator